MSPQNENSPKYYFLKLDLFRRNLLSIYYVQCVLLIVRYTRKVRQHPPTKHLPPFNKHLLHARHCAELLQWKEMLEQSCRNCGGRLSNLPHVTKLQEIQIYRSFFKAQTLNHYTIPLQVSRKIPHINHKHEQKRELVFLNAYRGPGSILQSSQESMK